MLFNSYIFICAFLPISLVLFYTSRRIAGVQGALISLVLCSLFFYGWWNPYYLLLILGSAVCNYFLGRRIANSQRKIDYVVGLCLNVLLLGYFKYLNFFVDNANHFFSTGIEIQEIILPLAISFFTFQQISFLTSCYKTGNCETKFERYLLFICFFPQLIAGPIVHHNEIFKQFTHKNFARFNAEVFTVGVCIFIVGLAKKLLLADPLASYVDPVFSTAADGGNFSNSDAWMALTAFKFQLYFDFSGYADMAVGLGLMFGIRLPINFESPYKAGNMFDFWNRWHTTLARFMRGHIFRPLARVFNFSNGVQIALVINIIIGGLWHGANWNFLLWGLFNGLLLLVNHGYRKASQQLLSPALQKAKSYIVFCIVFTFVATMFSSVLFRSDNLMGIEQMLKHLLFSNNYSSMLTLGAIDIIFMVGLFALIWLFPNTRQIFNHFKPGISLVRKDAPTLIKFQIRSFSWKHGLVFGTLFFVCFIFLSREVEFIYFQF